MTSSVTSSVTRMKGAMSMSGFVQSIVDRSNCTSEYGGCRRCTSQLIENLRDSRWQGEAFRRAMVRLFVMATEPKMACEDEREKGVRHAAEQVSKAAVVVSTFRKKTLSARSVLRLKDASMADTAADGDGVAMDVLQPAGKVSRAPVVASSDGSALRRKDASMADMAVDGDGLAMDALQPVVAAVVASSEGSALRRKDASMADTAAVGDGLAMMRRIVGHPITDGSIEQLFAKYAYLFRSPRSDGRKSNRCFDASRIMSALRTSSGDDQYVQLAQMTAGFIYLNYSYPCRTPSKDIFLRQLFASYGSGEHLTRSDLSRMIDDLDLYPAPSDKHERRRKRDMSPAPPKPACFDLDVILKTFAIDHDDELISWNQFVAISPALIHQMLNCRRQTPDKPQPEGKGQLTTAQKWGYGVVAVTIVSVSSIGGVFVFPLVKGRAYDATLHFFVAMAVASLTGDALLHLIPFFVGIHDHGDSDDSEEGVHVDPYFYKLLTAHMAIFGFYLFELFLRLMWMPSANKTEKSRELHDVSSYTDDTAVAVMLDNQSHSSGHHHHSYREDSSPGERRRRTKCCGLTAVTAMITLGDALHNFADGMAIAAAFSVSGSFGLSTSVAILCHEVPHELGDMAVYLSTGMSMCHTVLLNLLASLTCYLGLFVGYGVASQSSVAQEWILAVTSGFFFYIALSDLLPELAGPAEKNPKLIVCHFFGFMLGALIIIIIAVYEEQIRL